MYTIVSTLLLLGHNYVLCDILMCTAPDDYASATTLYTFTPGQMRLDIPVTIVDDAIFEGDEQFLGRLSTSNANAAIDVPQTTVIIGDNDRKFLLVTVHMQIMLQLMGTVCIDI